MIVDSMRPKKPPELAISRNNAKRPENFLSVSRVQYGSALTESSFRRARTEAAILKAGVAAWPMK